ncbi:Kelch repeat-containing protein [Microbacterium pumilum]|uniref:Kelch repeat-containing protein n=1 Tax=Microbacterium pumilum TaxID=344165 RepID=UPI003CD06F78
MPTARERFRLVASGRYLYAIGGNDFDFVTLTTVERYDPKSDTWRSNNPLRESRTLPCAVETTVEKPTRHRRRRRGVLRRRRPDRCKTHDGGVRPGQRPLEDARGPTSHPASVA